LERSGIEVEMAVSEDLPPLAGDAKLLRTAVDNLLDNAGKHASTGRWIRVSTLYSAAEKEVQVAVEDRGAGIDPAEEREIFEPFSRGRAAMETHAPGSGLGLSLVRSAVQAHHGAVTLASEPGRGSTFTLHLPV
jgi:signal transduction histidine kinase